MEQIFCSMFAILIGITGADLGSATQPQVVSNVLIVQTGTIARFNCTAVQDNPVHWATTPYGSKTPKDIYSGSEPLVEDYGRSGRFALVVNTTLRRYDLIINNTMLIDGGLFVCDDNGGYGNKTYTDLVVYDWPICRVDSSQKSYMGHNVFDLSPDIMHFSCRMNYNGNADPWFIWSVGGQTFEGNRGNESRIAFSSLDLVPRRILNNTTVTWEAIFKRGSDEVVRRGILGTFDPLRIHFAEWHNKAVNECPGVEWTLNCNPLCTYELELVNCTHNCCLMNYSTGANFYQISSCVKVDSCSEVTGSSDDGNVPIIVGGVLGAIVVLIVGALIGFLCGINYQSLRSWCTARREINGRPNNEIPDVNGPPIIDERAPAEAMPMIRAVSSDSELTSEQGASAEERL